MIHISRILVVRVTSTETNLSIDMLYGCTKSMITLTSHACLTRKSPEMSQWASYIGYQRPV